MKKTATEWVRKAESDYRLAKKIARGNELFHDQLCFHCQQAVEKYLKALLEEMALPIPHTHDLDRLRTLLLPQHPSLRSLQRGMLFLTTYAVETRYPGRNATKRQANAALRRAEEVRHEVRSLLGLPPRPAKRKRKP